MRSAERELLEIERKRQATDSSSSATARLKSTGDVAKERLADITKQIAEESKRLAATRASLQKLKTTNSGTASNGAASSSSNIKAFFDPADKETAPSSASKKSAATSSAAAQVPSGRPLVNIVSEDLYPELCK